MKTLTTWLREHWRDYALPTGLLLLFVLPAVGALSGALTLLGLGMVVALYGRRHHPVPVFAINAALCLVQVQVTDFAIPADVALLIALHAVIVERGWRPWGTITTAVTGFGAGIAAVDWTQAMVTHSRTGRPEAVASAFIVCVLAIVATVAIAEANRRRAQLLEQLHQRTAAAERERDQQARIATQDERARIAREMHDVVAHALAVIVVQADGAAFRASKTDTDPAVAQAVSAISVTARRALAETRELVGVLREGDDTRTPTASYADLPRLAERLRDLGREVEFDDRLAGEPVPAGAGRALYRVAQEACTNVLKHAGPEARIRITVDTCDPPGARLTIEDTGRGPAFAESAGNGIAGMRERVAAFGGELRTGGRPGGGFRVVAIIPFTNGSRATPTPRVTNAPRVTTTAPVTTTVRETSAADTDLPHPASEKLTP